jgi:hypothetical protein
MTQGIDIARRASQRLSSEFGESLPAAVEHAIHGAEGSSTPIDEQTLAAEAIVGCADLAWRICSSFARERKRDVEALRRELRAQLRVGGKLDGEAQSDILDAVIEVAIEEVQNE